MFCPEPKIAELEIDTLTFFNVLLFISLNEMQGKAVVKKYLMLYMDALILTFSPLIWRQQPFLHYFSVVNTSQIFISLPCGVVMTVSVSVAPRDMTSRQSHFQYDFE